MPRFLHTADWQIDRQFSSFDPEHAPMLADARIQAVEALARLATELQVDAVLGFAVLSAPVTQRRPCCSPAIPGRGGMRVGMRQVGVLAA